MSTFRICTAEIHHHFFGLCSVQKQTILITPLSKGLHQLFVLILPSIPDVCHNRSIIQIVLEVAEPGVVHKVYCVQGEQEGSQSSASVLLTTLSETHFLNLRVHAFLFMFVFQ